MQPLYPFLALMALGFSGLVWAVCFMTVLFGMPLHGFLAALMFSSSFMLGHELRTLARAQARPSRTNR